LDLDSRFVTAVSSAASAMQDQSGSANNCAGATGYSAAGGVNGLPKITLSGLQSMTSATRAVPSGSARTAYFVAAPTSVAAILTLFTFGLGTPYATLQATTSAGGLTIYSDGVAVNITCAANPASGVHLYTYKLPSFGNTQTMGYAIDNTPETVAGGNLSHSDTGTAGYQMGSNSASQGWHGDWYRGCVVNRLTKTQEDAAIHAMMQALYGVP